MRPSAARFCSRNGGRILLPADCGAYYQRGRLQLAILERCVTDLGGTYAMEDTHSMAIVATEAGGLIQCPGGQRHADDGREAIRALSWAQVQEIVGRFEALNPYDREAVPGSILKIEDDNFDPVTGQQREIHCLDISAKRYALFGYNERGEPELLQKGLNNKTDGWSEHGLGHLLNPTNPYSDDRDWTRQVWLYLIREAHGLEATRPAWFDRPAFSRITVSSPAVLKPLAALNAGKPYLGQIKPFNFLLSAHIAPNGHPIGVDPNGFHLIAPYESDARKWERLLWIDQYSGKLWRGTTLGNAGTRVAARFKTHGDVVDEYEYHPESKSADAAGKPCDRQTVGLLRRRHVAIDSFHHIGKESNQFENVLNGSIAAPDQVYTEYVDLKRSHLYVVLRSTSIREVARRSGLARSTIQRIKNRSAKPRQRSIARIGQSAAELLNVAQLSVTNASCLTRPRL